MYHEYNMVGATTRPALGIPMSVMLCPHFVTHQQQFQKADETLLRQFYGPKEWAHSTLAAVTLAEYRHQKFAAQHSGAALKHVSKQNGTCLKLK